MSMEFQVAEKISALKMSERLATGLELRESHFREFKSTLDYSTTSPKNREPKAVCKDIGETLVAFANADGGELFVGVEDDGTVSGIHNNEDVVQMFLRAYKTHVHAD